MEYEQHKLQSLETGVNKLFLSNIKDNLSHEFWL